MTVEESPDDLTRARRLDAEASTLMKQGIRLAGQRSPDARSEALALFERATELRRLLPIQRLPVFAYNLAACWLNRAEVLAAMGGDRLAAAIDAFEEALTLLSPLPLGEDPRFPRRLAIAHQNRGLALIAIGRPGESTAAFTTAIAALSGESAAAVPDRQYLLGAIWMNLANARAVHGPAPSTSDSREAARQALAAVRDLEVHDPEATDVGLKARHVLCRVIATTGLSLEPITHESGADVHEATDLADDGLALVRQWERRGVARFRPIASDLFRFGAHVYARHQPQFLAEFVAEQLNPRHSSDDYVASDEMQAAAGEFVIRLPARKM